MIAEWLGRTPTQSSPNLEAYQALRSTSMTAAGKPFLLGYGPVARMNPYQALIYRDFPSRGIAVSPVFEVSRLQSLLSLAPLTSGVGLHLHWTSGILAKAESAESAHIIARGFLGRVDRFRQSGGKLVWTVHNVYPHDARYLEAELELQQGIADRADVVHVMSAQTPAMLGHHLTYDSSKELVSPHPSYVGAYENYVSRAEARQSLGIDADEIVLVAFGALKGYKGLHELASGFERLLAANKKQRIRLLVAGASDTNIEVKEFVSWSAAHPRVILDNRVIPQHLAQYFLRAADVGILGYTRSLNSGAALLYQSFGLPVLATDTPVMREALDPGSAKFFDPAAGSKNYASALEEIITMSREVDANSVVDRLAHLAPEVVSKSFGSELIRRLSVS